MNNCNFYSREMKLAFSFQICGCFEKKPMCPRVNKLTGYRENKIGKILIKDYQCLFQFHLLSCIYFFGLKLFFFLVTKELYNK